MRRRSEKNKWSLTKSRTRHQRVACHKSKRNLIMVKSLLIHLALIVLLVAMSSSAAIAGGGLRRRQVLEKSSDDSNKAKLKQEFKGVKVISIDSDTRSKFSDHSKPVEGKKVSASKKDDKRRSSGSQSSSGGNQVQGESAAKEGSPSDNDKEEQITTNKKAPTDSNDSDESAGTEKERVAPSASDDSSSTSDKLPKTKATVNKDTKVEPSLNETSSKSRSNKRNPGRPVRPGGVSSREHSKLFKEKFARFKIKTHGKKYLRPLAQPDACCCACSALPCHCSCESVQDTREAGIMKLGDVVADDIRDAKEQDDVDEDETETIAIQESDKERREREKAESKAKRKAERQAARREAKRLERERLRMEAAAEKNANSTSEEETDNEGSETDSEEKNRIRRRLGPGKTLGKKEHYDTMSVLMACCVCEEYPCDCKANMLVFRMDTMENM